LIIIRADVWLGIPGALSTLLKLLPSAIPSTTTFQIGFSKEKGEGCPAGGLPALLFFCSVVIISASCARVVNQIMSEKRLV
jgi:hypothetical protein